jgi:hypothetical protein
VAKEKKPPGRFRQLWRVYKTTAKSDPTSAWLAALVLLLAIAVGLAVGFVTGDGNVFTLVLWGLSGMITGVLFAMIVMSNKAEKNAYKNIEGQAGAVGAVLDSQIKRGWRTSSMPVAVNAKTREAIYRMIGRPGVVLISEGSSARVQQMLDDEARKVLRSAPGAAVHKVRVTVDDSGVRIYRLLKHVYKLPKSLSRGEVTAVSNRLDALGAHASVPIPKGIDPNRVRAPKRKS